MECTINPRRLLENIQMNHLVNKSSLLNYKLRILLNMENFSAASGNEMFAFGVTYTKRILIGINYRTKKPKK